MPVNSKTFSQLVTFSRASGATRVNSAGRIVGVDFSSTSNTIGTGSKTFTLTADAGVNRDWPAGSAIRAVDQVGGGTMIGTVTSYNATTQELVINVASITGSGTSTNWRIGSLEFRRDFDPVTLAPRGGLVEGQATNSVTDTRLTNNGLLAGLIRRLNAGVAPNGITEATELESGTNALEGGAGQVRDVGVNAGAGVPRGQSLFVKVVNLVGGTGKVYMSAADRVLEFSFNLATLSGTYRRSASSGANTTDTPLVVQAYPNGWYRVSAPGLVNSTSSENRLVFEAAIGSIIQVWCPQVEAGSTFVSSPIPTTTVAVTRAADVANIDGTRFSGAYNQSQGTLYVEMTPLAGAVQAVAASLNDGTVNNAIRIGQKQSGTLSSIRAIASDGVTDVMAVNDSSNPILRSNGIDYQLTSASQNASSFAVASSGVGNFLVGGISERILSTSNGGETLVERGVSSVLVHAGAHFGIGRFVIASSGGSVIVSTDGLTFRRINIPGLTQNLNEITSNGTNQYVAVGNGGVIYTSPDAETWTAQTSGTTASLLGVAFFGGRYVAVSNTAGASRYSDNGTSWAAVTGLAASMIDVSHNGTNLWVAVGGAGSIFSSADGITWTARTSGVTTSFGGVHFADGLWVAVGGTGTVVTSPDGITWTDRTATSGTTQNLTEVGSFGGKFYYVGLGQTVAENTAANIVANVTWTARPVNVGATMIGIATNGTRLLVCGNNGVIVTSDDGVTFTSRTGHNAQLNGAAFGAGTYVVVGNVANGSGLIATVDPTTFAYTRRVSNTASNVQNVRFLNGVFYAPRSSFGVVRSLDGSTWSDIQITGTGAAALDIDFGSGVYVIVGGSGRVATSSDGLAWSLAVQTGVTLANFRAIKFANGLFVAVGDEGTIITSPNGTTWTARTSGVTSALNAVHWSTRDQCFYAAGDAGVILQSFDGITWENIANDAIGAVMSGGAIQSNPALPNLTPNAINKVAMRYAGNDFAVSVNGADAVADASGSVPAVNRLSLGMSGTGANPFNGHIRKIQYFPVTKTNAELKGLTT